jgi:hypothetical protein
VLLGCRYGSGLVLNGKIDFQHMMRSLLAVTMSAQSLGQNTSFL